LGAVPLLGYFVGFVDLAADLQIVDCIEDWKFG
jgi:hypothetical protein